jgi:hypothetical protein
VSRYTCKHLEADLDRLRESVPGWTGENADGTFRVEVDDRGGSYPYRYTLVMAYNGGRGPISNHVPGWPYGWPGRYFRTAREVWGEMHAAAYWASQAKVAS